MKSLYQKTHAKIKAARTVDELLALDDATTDLYEHEKLTVKEFSSLNVLIMERIAEIQCSD